MLALPRERSKGNQLLSKTWTHPTLIGHVVNFNNQIHPEHKREQIKFKGFLYLLSNEK